MSSSAAVIKPVAKRAKTKSEASTLGSIGVQESDSDTPAAYRPRRIPVQARVDESDSWYEVTEVNKKHAAPQEEAVAASKKKRCAAEEPALVDLTKRRRTSSAARLPTTRVNIAVPSPSGTRPVTIRIKVPPTKVSRSSKTRGVLSKADLGHELELTSSDIEPKSKPSRHTKRAKTPESEKDEPASDLEVVKPKPVPRKSVRRHTTKAVGEPREDELEPDQEEVEPKANRRKPRGRIRPKGSLELAPTRPDEADSLPPAKKAITLWNRTRIANDVALASTGGLTRQLKIKQQAALDAMISQFKKSAIAARGSGQGRPQEEKKEDKEV